MKVDEIVVTSEMEEAGFRVLCNSGIAGECLEADKLTLAEIYRSMFSLSPDQQRNIFGREGIK